MPQIKEIRDGGPNPLPTIEELCSSQRAGSVGQGTNTESYADRMAVRNHGTGKGEDSDEKFAEAANYKESGNESGLPWLE